MTDNLIGKQMLFTKLQNFSLLKGYGISKFLDLVPFLIKENETFRFRNILQKTHQVAQLLSD